MAITDGLVSGYMMDQLTGNEPDVLSVNTLTENGTIGTTTGKLNGARGSFSNFDYFSKSSPTGLNNQAVSWSWWLKANSLAGFDCPGVYTASDSWNNGFGWRYIASGEGWGFWLQAYNADIVQTHSVSTGVWYHLVATWDGTTLKMYKNGTLEDTLAASPTVDFTAAIFEVGRGFTGSRHDGFIDEFFLWNRAITLTEVQTLYGGGTPPAYPWEPVVGSGFFFT